MLYTRFGISFRLVLRVGCDNQRQRVLHSRTGVAPMFRLSTLLPLPRGQHAQLSLISGTSSPRFSGLAQRKGLFDPPRKGDLICFHFLSLSLKANAYLGPGIYACRAGIRKAHLPRFVPQPRTSSFYLPVFLILLCSPPVLPMRFPVWLPLYHNPRFDSHSFLSF